MFANPWLLVGLGAGVAPIIIHLLSKRRFVRVAWAAMHWLLESLEENQRRLRLEELILLLVRMAILVLLALGLARLLLESPALYDGVIWLFFTIPLALAVWGVTELRAPARWRWPGRALAAVLGIGSLAWVLLTLSALLSRTDSFHGGWTLRARAHRVIVLDHSYSMGQKAGARSAFEQARQTAVWLLQPEAELRGGDVVTVILAGTKPRILVAASSDLRAVRGELQVLKVSDETTDLPAALTAAYEELAKREGFPRRELFVITDLTRNAWLDDDGALRDKRFLQRAARIDPEKRPLVAVVDVGPRNETATANLALVGLETETDIIAAGLPVTFLVHVANDGSEDKPNVNVTLEMQDSETANQSKTIGSKRIDVKAGFESTKTKTSTVVRFTHVFERPGAVVVTARIRGDSLAADNRRRLALQVRERVKLLCVDGEAAVEALSGETDLLVRALSPRAVASGGERSILAPEQIDEVLLSEARFHDYDVVILANVAEVPAAKRQTLRNYVAGGGAVLIFLGERVDAPTYNDTLFVDKSFKADKAQAAAKFLPARLLETRGVPRASADGENPVSFQGGPYTHPALKLFNHVSLGGVQIHKRFRCAVDADDRDVTVALRYADGDPAIIERRLGRGRVLMLTTTADMAWNNLAARPVYVPLLHELVAYLVRSSQARLNVSVGDTITRFLSAEELHRGLTITGPPPDTIPWPVRPDGSGMMFTYGPVERAGTYRLDVGNEAERRVFFTVNLRPEESRLERIGEQELRGLLDEVQPNIARGAADLKKLIVGAGKRRELWLPFVATVLGLLLIETLLARIFGHRGDQA